jgi:hypothetical protein
MDATEYILIGHGNSPEKLLGIGHGARLRNRREMRSGFPTNVGKTGVNCADGGANVCAVLPFTATLKIRLA